MVASLPLPTLYTTQIACKCQLPPASACLPLPTSCPPPAPPAQTAAAGLWGKKPLPTYHYVSAVKRICDINWKVFSPKKKRTEIKNVSRVNLGVDTDLPCHAPFRTASTRSSCCQPGPTVAHYAHLLPCHAPFSAIFFRAFFCICS